jgi:hypothetical protein
MVEYDLGPNGALIFCIDFLLKNVDWLMSRLAHLGKTMLIVDCPGQVELYA